MKTLIKVKYNNEDILSVDSQSMSDKIVRCLLTFDTEISDVEVTFEDDSKRSAKKFILNKKEGMKMESIGLFFIFPKGSIFYIYK